MTCRQRGARPSSCHGTGGQLCEHRCKPAAGRFSAPRHTRTNSRQMQQAPKGDVCARRKALTAQPLSSQAAARALGRQIFPSRRHFASLRVGGGQRQAPAARPAGAALPHGSGGPAGRAHGTCGLENVARGLQRSLPPCLIIILSSPHCPPFFVSPAPIFLPARLTAWRFTLR